MRKAAETIRRHIANIVTYYQHPVTNATSEGLNSQIQKIRAWPTDSETSSTLRPPSTSTAEGSICTHAKPGSAQFGAHHRHHPFRRDVAFATGHPLKSR